MKKPRKKGRPAKKPDDRRVNTITVLLSNKELEQFTTGTNKLRVSNSSFMRAATRIILGKIETGEVDVDEFLKVADDK